MNATRTAVSWLILLSACVPPDQLLQLTLTPREPELAVGERAQVSANAVLGNGSVSRVVPSFEVADASVVQLELEGDVAWLRGLRAGHTTLTARLGGALVETTILVREATLQGIEISRPANSLPLGLATRLKATSSWSDGVARDATEAVIWSTDDPQRAQFAGATLRAVGEGRVLVRAALGDYLDSFELTISAAVKTGIIIEPSELSVPLGLSGRFVVKTLFSDGTTAPALVDWAVAEPSGLKLSPMPDELTVVAERRGTWEVTARRGADVQLASVTVTEPEEVELIVSPMSLPMGLSTDALASVRRTDGSTVPLKSGRVEWSVSDSAIAEVSNAPSTQGTVRGLLTGGTTLRAEYGSLSATAPVWVAAPVVVDLWIDGPTQLSVGQSAELVTHAQWSDGRLTTPQVVLASSNNSVLRVRFTGRNTVDAYAPGAVTLFSYHGGRMARHEMTVIP